MWYLKTLNVILDKTERLIVTWILNKDMAREKNIKSMIRMGYKFIDNISMFIRTSTNNLLIQYKMISTNLFIKNKNKNLKLLGNER